MTSLLENVRDETKPDAIFWLGDSIPHNVDTLNAESNVQIMTNVSQLVADELITLGDYTGKFFPTPGNHDSYP